MADAKDDLAELVDCLDRCAKVAHSFLEVERQGSGHFRLLCFCFLAKMCQHAESVIALGASKDTTLIARSMIEGRWQLRWVLEDREQRASQWLGFGTKNDLQIAKTDPDSITTDHWERITHYLAEHHGEYLGTRRGRGSPKVGKLPEPNDFGTSWLGTVNYWEIAKLYEDTELYETLYRGYADWAHWNPAAFAGVLETENNRARYEPDSYNDAASSVSIAFDCLREVFRITCDAVGCSAGEEFEQLVRDYTAKFVSTD